VTITLRCPECQQVVQFSDQLAGLQGRCPLCTAAVPVPAVEERQQERISESPLTRPAVAAPSPPFAVPIPRAYDAPPRPPRPLDDDTPPYRHYDDRGAYGRAPEVIDPGWHTTRTALTLMKSSLIVMIFATLGWVGLLLVESTVGTGPFGRPRGPETRMLVALGAMLVGFAMIVGLLLWVIGQCMCCTTPLESGTRGLGLGSMICTVLGLLLFLFFIFLAVALDSGAFRGQFGGPPAPAAFILMFGTMVLSAVLFVVGHLLFVLFLRGVARFFGNESLSNSCMGYLVLYLFIVIAFIVFLFFVAFLNAAQGGMRPGLDVVLLGGGVALLVVTLVAIIWLLGLVGLARDTIQKNLRARY
jgi:hypothetical protein